MENIRSEKSTFVPMEFLTKHYTGTKENMETPYVLLTGSISTTNFHAQKFAKPATPKAKRTTKDCIVRKKHTNGIVYLICQASELNILPAWTINVKPW